VGVVAAHDGGVQHARELQIADEDAAPPEQAVIFAAENGPADETRRCGIRHRRNLAVATTSGEEDVPAIYQIARREGQPASRSRWTPEPPPTLSIRSA
jgi:hypothetical protein